MEGKTLGCQHIEGKPVGPTVSPPEKCGCSHLQVVEGIHLHDRAHRVQWEGDLHRLVGGKGCVHLERGSWGQAKAGRTHGTGSGLLSHCYPYPHPPVLGPPGTASTTCTIISSRYEKSPTHSCPCWGKQRYPPSLPPFSSSSPLIFSVCVPPH